MSEDDWQNSVGDAGQAQTPFKLNIGTKIFLFTLVPIVLVLVFISLLTIQNKANTEQTLMENRIASFVGLLESGELSFESIKDKALLENLFQEKVIHAKLIDREQNIAYSTQTAGDEFSSDDEADLVNQALAGYKVAYTRQDKGSTTFEWYYPILVDKRVIGVFNAELSYERSNERIRQYALFILFLDLVGVIVSLGFIYLLINRSLISNIEKLKEATEELSKGNLDYKTDIRSRDELEELGFFFNRMGKDLNVSRLKLEGYSKELEVKVQERTRELQGKNEELEKFNKLAIGRELKLVKMKDKITELEAQLSGKKVGSVKAEKLKDISDRMRKQGKKR
ncbi:HAMP domain-containing protein [Candidatus Woesearchaeota archaeon]|nr:HAMP domain-containing protein [Candidatus Woesearchaeota archaeon]